MKTWDDRLMAFLDSPVNVVVGGVLLLLLVLGVLYHDQVWFYTRLIAKSLRRNVLRSAPVTVREGETVSAKL